MVGMMKIQNKPDERSRRFEPRFEPLSLRAAISSAEGGVSEIVLFRALCTVVRPGSGRRRTFDAFSFQGSSASDQSESEKIVLKVFLNSLASHERMQCVSHSF